MFSTGPNSMPRTNLGFPGQKPGQVAGPPTSMNAFSTGPNSMPSGGNVFQQAAGNLTAATQAAQRVAAFTPAGVAPSYDPRMISANFAPQMVSSDYDPRMVSANFAPQMLSGNYDPRMVGAGQVSRTNLQPYMNPFQRQVIDRTIDGLDRTRRSTLNDVGAAASAAGAFGGSRHGVAESLTNAEFSRSAADTMAGLNAANFSNAQTMAGADIDRRFQAASANQQAGLAAAGLNQQALLANQQAGLTADGMRLQAQQANQQAGFQGAQLDLQALLANQQAGLAANNTILQAQQANQQAGLQGAQLDQQARLANQQAGIAGAGLQLQAAGQLGNLSNLGFGQGQQIIAGQQAQGNQQQQMMQALIDAAQGQFQGAAGAPTQGLATLMAALGGVPFPQSETTSQRPGLLQLLSLGLGAS